MHKEQRQINLYIFKFIIYTYKKIYQKMYLRGLYPKEQHSTSTQVLACFES